MKIPGTTKVQLSLLTILMISSVSSTALQISARASNTLEENTSGKSVDLNEASDESPQSQTGSDITEALQSLNKILNHLEKKISEEKSYQSTPHWDEPTMRRPDNSSSTTCSPSP